MERPCVRSTEGAVGARSVTEFATKRLHFAIYLHASGRLPFLRTEPNGDGKLRFVFRDDQSWGPQLELEFERGATVSARDLFSSQTFLRRQMTQAENLNTGESKNVGIPR
jgi:hypothetical protein